MSDKAIKNILIVDDDPGEIKLLTTILTQNGYNVTAVQEADVGLQTALTEKPDLILLDVMMPIINGFHFCKLMKEESDQKHIAIILVTSRDQESDIEIGLEMGADAYLCKPIDTAEMLKTIKVVENNLE